MVYKCVQNERKCDTCEYEPVCYDSEYIMRLFNAVPPSKLQKTDYVSAENVDL